MARKEATKPSRVIICWITLLSRFKHHIIISSFDVFLVAHNSIQSILIEVYRSSCTFLGLKVLESHTLVVRFQVYEIFELWTYDILNSKCALKQELWHCICSRTVLFCNWHHLLKFLIVKVLMTSFSSSKSNYLGSQGSDARNSNLES